MQSEKTNIFGIINIFPMLLVNIANAFWTLWLTIEQIATGWGFPTNLELGVLYPWMFQVISLPFVILCLIFLIISFFKKPNKWILIINIVLFTITVLQFGLTNLFIWY